MVDPFVRAKKGRLPSSPNRVNICHTRVSALYHQKGANYRGERRMAQKTKPRVAKEKRAVGAKRSPRKKVAVTGQSLRLASKRADLLVRRTARSYVDKAADLDAARTKRREAERQLAGFCANEAERVGRPFYNFLAQGDSWFDYTCGSAIIHWLSGLFKPENAYFDNIAESGRTLRQMVSREFKEHLAAGPPSGQPWNAVLLSGGGNDICGEHRFRDWLKPYDGKAHPPDYYIHSDFDHEVDALRKLYVEAFDIVANAAKNARVFAHDYDFAIPDSRCVTGHSPHLQPDVHFCFAGPWLGPAFDERGFPRMGDENVPQLACDVVVAILKRFAAMLEGLERQYPDRFFLVRTQGVLTPIQATQLWVNELHPYDDSFEVLAKTFYDKLRSFL